MSDTPFEIPDTPLGPTDRFTHRPSHPDFARIVELTMQLDAETQTLGVEMFGPAIIEPLVNEESLGYAALQRTGRVMSLPNLIPELRAATLYLEGFVLGCRYEQKYGKGHRGNQGQDETTS